MTHYIAAYDTEQLGNGVPSCLEACRHIVEVHHRYEMPATFFIVGRLLEAKASEFRALLDDPLFEIASHTYSHRMFRDHPICGPAASPEVIRGEIFRGKQVVEDVFGQRCVGLRTGCGFDRGLRGAPQILQWLQEAGLEYVSSLLWGPDFTVPAPLNQAFTYEEDGYPGLRELPGHGFHENLLKGNNRLFGLGAARMLLFPPIYPEAIPDDYIKTPEEEMRYNNRVFIDRAIAGDLDYVSLIWHPWSLMLFDPELRMLDMTFRYVRERNLTPSTFAGFNAWLSDR